MPRFFVDNVHGTQIIITGDDAVHIGRSLRMKKGDRITVCSEKTDYECIISGISGSEVTACIENFQPSPAEPDVNLVLYQAVPKSDKLELIIQKSVEIGVSKIVPIITNRCVSRPDKKDFTKKLARYNKICLEAAKQSGRGIIPEVTHVLDYKNALSEMHLYNHAFILYEKGGISFSQTNIKNSKNIAIIIGSEGGFDADEISLAEHSGVKSVWLGNRILRCETAPITAASIIMFLTENL